MRFTLTSLKTSFNALCALTNNDKCKLRWFYDPLMHKPELTDLVSCADIHIFTESISFGQWCGTVFHKVEGFERTKWCQELFNLYNSRGRTGMWTQQHLQLKSYPSPVHWTQDGGVQDDRSNRAQQWLLEVKISFTVSKEK